MKNSRVPSWPLGIVLLNAAAILLAFSIHYLAGLICLGLTGLVAVATVWNFAAERRVRACSRPAELRSTITCPYCGHQKSEVLPGNAYLCFYECRNCHARLRPKAGDCCVFCSFGSLKCQPGRLDVPSCVP